MTVYDNYVYMTICEFSIPMIKDTNYSTYGAFCRGIGWAINHLTLSGKEKSDVNKIFAHLTLIYGMSDDETAKYLYTYFTENLYNKYEYSVKLTKEYFPFTGD